MARSSHSGYASARATAARIASVEDEAQLMLACDFDTQQMEQAEYFLTTIMDERAAQDAFDLEIERAIAASQAEDDGCEASGEIQEEQQQPVSAEPMVTSSTEAPSISCPSSPAPNSPDSSATAAAHSMPPPLELSIVESSEGLPVQWSLISPWSEGDEDAERSSPESTASPVFFQQDDRTEDDESSSVVEPESEARMEARLRELVETETAMALEAKLSRAANGGSDEDEDAITRDIDVDEDDEEFDVYNNNNGNMFAKAIGGVEELFEERLDNTATEEDENEEYTDGTRTSVATTMDDSCEDSPRASSSGNKASWVPRIRSQTYNGSAAVSSVKNACKMIRSRTLSTTSSFRRSSESRSSESLVDDGDFSSDDEGCSRASRKDGSFSSTRSTLTSRFSLKVPNRMSINWRTRTSSATTTASEDSSYPTSPLNSVRDEAQSGFSFSTIEDPFTPKTGSPQNQQQQSNTHVMQVFKNKASVCASQAAGYLNSKSVEAARKIKARTFRGAAVVKFTASETEEETESPSLSEATA